MPEMIPTVLPGGHSEPEPPESIPNSQVKTLTVRDLRWYAIRILSVERQSGFYPLWDLRVTSFFFAVQT